MRLRYQYRHKREVGVLLGDIEQTCSGSFFAEVALETSSCSGGEFLIELLERDLDSNVKYRGGNAGTLEAPTDNTD